MIENPRYFEENLAQFILNSLGREYIEKIELEGVPLSTWNTKVNLHGFILMKNKDIFSKLQSQEELKKNDKYYEDDKNYQEYVDKWNNNYKIVKGWEDNLKHICPELINSSEVYLSLYKQQDKKISLSAWYAMYDTPNWLKNHQKYPLTKEEELILVQELIETSRYNLKNNSLEEKIIIVDLIEKHQEQIKKKRKENDEQWINTLLKSNTIKLMIEKNQVQDLGRIFNEKYLLPLFRKCNLQENIDNYPNMLINLLPVASPEKWATIHKEGFNINKFFDMKFGKAFQYSLMDSRYRKQTSIFSKQKDLQQIVYKEMEYLSPILNSKYVSQENLRDFWEHIIKNRGKRELIIEACKWVELPDKTKEENQNFYDTWKNSTMRYHIGSMQDLSLPQIFQIAQKEKLENELNKKDKKIKRLKI